MAFPNSNLLLSKVVAVVVMCLAVQPSFSLPQGIGGDSSQADSKIENASTSVTEGQSELLQQTENTEEKTGPNHDDSSSCFLYFISQDINSLLHQARRMLSRSTTDRQRSWLILYVHNLESLSRKLRQLPVENKSHCFQMRERLESETGNNNKELSSAPDEVQLRFAKKLFRVSQKQTIRIGKPDYVTGTITTGPSQDPTAFDIEEKEAPSQSNGAHIAQSNKHIENSFANSKISEKLDVVPNIGSDVTGSGQELPKNLPVTYGDRINLDSESLPFLPRATRKVVPTEEKMRFRASFGHPRTAHSTTLTSTITNDEESTEVQTDHPTTVDVQHSNKMENAKKELTTANSDNPSENHHPDHRQLSTQNYKESLAQHHDDHKMNPAALGNHHFNMPHVDKTLETTTEYFDDDDLVVQLHSEGKYVAAPKMHPRMLQNTRPINIKVLSPVTPSAAPLEVEEKHDEIQNPEESSEKTEKADYDTITGISNINYEIPEVVPLQNENNLDFDYEEQGAAAGELFIDDEVIPAKYLTVPSSIGSTDSNDDDIAQQLDDLKSLKTDTLPRTEIAPPPKQKNVGFDGVHHLLTSNK